MCARPSLSLLSASSLSCVLCLCACRVSGLFASDVQQESGGNNNTHTHTKQREPLLFRSSLEQDVLAVSDNEAVYGSSFNTRESYTASLGKHRLFGQHFSSVQPQRKPYVSSYEMSRKAYVSSYELSPNSATQIRKCWRRWAARVGVPGPLPLRWGQGAGQPRARAHRMCPISAKSLCLEL